MSRRDEKLEALSQQIYDSLKKLPVDEDKEREITISISGNNADSIHVGSIVNITTPEGTRSSDLHELDSRELRLIRQELMAKSQSARWRCYLNPSHLAFCLLVLAGFVFAAWNFWRLLFTGIQAHFLVATPLSFFIILCWSLLLLISMKVMDRHRKIENIIINENQAIIDSIDVALRRRER